MKSFNTILTSRNKLNKVSVFKTLKARRQTTPSVPDPVIPDTFLPIDIWAEYLSAIKNQGKCGACYAQATVACLGDRLGLLSQGEIQVELSPYIMTVCLGVIDSELLKSTEYSDLNNLAHSSGACRGNTLENACSYLYKYGTVESDCFNEVFLSEKKIDLEKDISAVEQVPYCDSLLGSSYDMCTDDTGDGHGTPARFYRISHAYMVNPDVESIKREIYHFGPVVAGMVIYGSFLSEYNGLSVYAPKQGEFPEGGHAIRIVGWGPGYWLIANSWGTEWGLNGYFKLKWGECDIEQNVMGMIPDIQESTASAPAITDEHLDYTVEISNKDVQERLWFGVDPKTGYKFTSLEKLKKELITPKPLINPHRKLPDFKTFWAGQITKHGDVQFYYQLGFSNTVFDKLWQVVFLSLVITCLYILYSRNKK